MTACASGCTIRGEHLADCDGTRLPADADVPVECRGCLPRPAEHGVLCEWCWGRIQSLVRTLPALARHLEAMAVPTLSSPMGKTSEGGDSSRPSERSLYPAALADLDELHAMLATWADEIAAESPATPGRPTALTRWTAPDADGAREPIGQRHPGDLARLAAWVEPHLAWVSSQPWAGDFLADLAPAVSRTSSRWPTDPVERRVTDVRCPACGCQSLAVLPPAVYRADVTVRCTLPACGLTMSEDDWQATRTRALVLAQATR